MVINYFADKTILITGCDGFLGKALISRLVNIYDTLESRCDSSIHRIYAIDNGITGANTARPQRPYIHYFDESAISFDYSRITVPQLVLHLAGLASPAQYKKYPLETIGVAVDLTKRLLEYSRAWSSQFIFFSSSEIYGNPDPKNIPTTEEYNGYVACQGPRACYDESKRMGETLVYIYHTYFGLSTNIIRPFNVYGPGMSPHDYRMVPNLLRSTIRSETLQIYGDGLQTRTFCFLDDALDGIILTCSRGRPGETYNIGNPEPEVSMLELIRYFQKSTGVSCQYILTDYPDSYPADEPARRCPSISKANAHLGYHPTRSLEEGLSITYKWALQEYKQE